MPSIGEIRIDLVTDIAKLVSGLNKGSNILDRKIAGMTASLKQFNQGLEQVGRKLALKVTLPLTALAIAATKAADPTGRMRENIERLGLQAQAALRPLGEVLIRLFEEARPTLERIVSVINNLSRAFSELDPKTQRAIVKWGLIAAAAGPAMLAASSLTTTLMTLSRGLGMVTWAVGRLTLSLLGLGVSAVQGLVAAFTALLPVLPYVLGGLVAIGAAIAAFRLGQYFYDEFKVVQETAAATIANVNKGWEYLKFGFLVAMDGIRNAWDEGVAFLKRGFGGFLSIVVSGLDLIPDKALQAVGVTSKGMSDLRKTAEELSAATGGFDFAAKLKERTEALEQAKKSIDAIYQATIETIEREFSGKDRATGKSFMDVLGEDLGKAADVVGEKLTGLMDRIRGPMDWLKGKVGDAIAAVRKLLEDGPLPLVMTRRELEAFNKAAEEASRQYRQMREEATKIRFEILPEEQFAEELDRLRQLREEFPSIIDDEVFAEKVQRLQEQFLRLRDRALDFALSVKESITQLGRSLSDEFGRMVVTGKARFGELFSAWAQTLVAMAAQRYIFGPLTDALVSGLGRAISSAFMPTPVTIGGSGPGALPSYGGPGLTETGRLPFAAAGMAIDRGLQVFAEGGIVRRATLFPMARGVGLMGEAGPEAIMPLERIGGKLGVNAAGGGVIVNVYNETGGQSETRERRGPDGQRIIDVLIRSTVKSMFRDGSLDRDMAQTYGGTRRGTSR